MSTMYSDIHELASRSQSLHGNSARCRTVNISLLLLFMRVIHVLGRCGAIHFAALMLVRYLLRICSCCLQDRLNCTNEVVEQAFIMRCGEERRFPRRGGKKDSLIQHGAKEFRIERRVDLLT